MEPKRHRLRLHARVLQQRRKPRYDRGMSTTKEELYKLVEQFSAEKAERVLKLLMCTVDHSRRRLPSQIPANRPPAANTSTCCAGTSGRLAIASVWMWIGYRRTVIVSAESRKAWLNSQKIGNPRMLAIG
jgi:hypothetical protein